MFMTDEHGPRRMETVMMRPTKLAGLLLVLFTTWGSAQALRPHEIPAASEATKASTQLGDYYDEYGRPPAAFPKPHLKRLADAAYTRGHHEHALHMYRRASRWGDKFSQFSVGIMLWRGEGTGADRPQAWAWLALAAERGYPFMTDLRDHAWDALDEAERTRAAEQFAALADEYADVAVQPRADRLLGSARRAQQWALNKIYTLRSGRLRIGIELDNPKRYQYWNLVQYETDYMLDQPAGRVELRELRVIEDDIDRRSNPTKE
jgi:hypothetical protein